MSAEDAVVTARQQLKKRVECREENFLALVERGIFHYPRSPYLKLLEPKRIGFRDLKSWLFHEDLEFTLRHLASEGIYFTVDEFKGKVPVVRNGVSFTCNERMFDNPFLAHAYEVRSGATRSAGTRIRIDFDYLHQRSFYDAFLLNVHGCLNAPIANWFPIFPGAPGINSSLRFAHIGNPAQRWFSQVAGDQLDVNWEKRWGTKLIFAVHRLCSYPLAEPEYASLNDAYKLAEWASRVLNEHPKCVIYTFVASAVRVCIAAAEANLSLKGTKFFVTGEPLTSQKRKEIESVGAFAVPVYGVSEAGVIAAGCDKVHASSDHCHLYKDTTALITHKHTVPYSDMTVDSYLFTSLLYECPKLLLNVGMGDYGEISSGGCDCEFADIGFDTNLSGIRSYEKLTGEGVTFVHTDFMRILEQELPRKFGGRSTDYQLVEEEDSKGLPRLRLLISPRIGFVNQEEVLKQFMALLKKAEDSPESWAQAGTEMWKQCKMIVTNRDWPRPTTSGKILPFYLLRTNNQKDGNINKNSREQFYGVSCPTT
ncbi:MAG TPA: hypothetical protein VEG68_19595 [Terriglobales bacterium]|nr:hypothetical protein [Terriglobales bacterium]